MKLTARCVSVWVCLLLISAVKLYAQPSIASFNPANGAVGTLVTIKGTNLSAPTAVNIGSTASIVISQADTQVVAMVMPGAVTNNVQLINAGGTATSASNFTVTPTSANFTELGNKLVPTGFVGAPAFGGHVAISADGSTMAVSARRENGSTDPRGAIYVYTNSASGWVLQQKLTYSNPNNNNYSLGHEIAISADGNTIVSGDEVLSGQSQRTIVVIFKRNNGVWSSFQILQPNSVSFESNFGSSLALSADGNTLAVGAPLDNSFQGSVLIFTLNNGSYTQQGFNLLGSGVIDTSPRQGRAVALSADGNTLVFTSARDNNNGMGSIWIFTRTNGVWSQVGNKIPLSNISNGINLDRGVLAVNANGTTFALGIRTEDSFRGAVLVFTKVNGEWVQQGNKLSPSDATNNALVGFDVALSADGNILVAGGIGDNNFVGAAWLYLRTGTTWVQQGNKFIGSNLQASSGGYFGNGLAITPNGSTLLVGAPIDNTSIGAVFTYSGDVNLISSLQNITLSEGSIAPSFQARTFTYTASVSATTTSIMVTPTATQAGSTIQARINGGSYATVTSGNASLPLALNNGNNVVEILVTAINGSNTSTYTINISKPTPPPGNALNFDGVDDFVAVGAHSSYSKFTLQTWVNWQPTNNTDVQFICSRGNEIVEIHTGGTANGLRFIPAPGVYLDVANALPTNRWTHIALAYNPANNFAKIYINGIEQAYTLTGSLSTTLPQPSSTTLNIGNRFSNILFFKGSIDEFRFDTLIRSQAQIQADMRNTIPTLQSGLLLGYHFNMGVANASNIGVNTIGSVVNSTLATLNNFALTGGTSNYIESYALVVPIIQPATNVNATGFTLNWQAPPNGTVDNYLLDISTNRNFTSFLSGYNALSVTGTSTTVTGLTTGTTYYYRLRANKASVANQAAFTSDSALAINSALLLDNLVTSAGSLSPTFNSLQFNYSNYVTGNTTNINFTATLVNTSSTAAISINGGAFTALTNATASSNLPLNHGNNTVRIRVVSSTNDTLVYTVVVNRNSSSNSFLRRFTTSNGNIVTVNQFNYTFHTAFATTSFAITPTAEDSTTTLQLSVNGATPINITSGASTSNFPLNIGANTFVITTTAENPAFSSTYTITVVRALQPPGNAINFDGTNDIMQVGNFSFLSATTLTLQTWVKWTANTNSDLQFLFSRGNENFEVHTNTNGSLRFIPTGGVYLDVPNAIDTGRWYHLAFVYNPSASLAKIYVNGIDRAYTIAGGSISTPINTGGGGLIVGRRSDGSFPFKGSIDEFKVYNIAKTQAQIQADMLSTVIPEETGMFIGYNFDFNTPSGNNTGSTSVPGFSALINNGTLQNFALTGNTSNWVQSYAMVVPTATAATNVTGTSFTANWNAPNIGTADYYLIDVSSNANFNTYVSGYQNLQVNGTSQVVNGLTNGTTYYYRIKAATANFPNEGAFSNTVSLVALNSNVQLSSLVLSAGTLSPTFNSSVLNYTNNVGGDISSVTITPTLVNNTSSLAVRVNTGNFITINNAAESPSLALNFATNTLTIRVTATDNSTIDYVVLVNRQAGSNAALANLISHNAKMINAAGGANFDSTITAYVINLSNKDSVLKFTAFARDTSAAIAYSIDGTNYTNITHAQITPDIIIPVTTLPYAQTINFRVISENLVNTRIYRVAVARSGSLPGNAINLDGVDDLVMLSTNPTNFSFNSITVELWTKWMANSNSDLQFLFSRGSEVIEAHTSTNGGLRFIPRPGVYLDVANAIDTGRWTHLAFVYDPSNSNAKIYVNGQERTYTVANGNISLPLFNNFNPFYFGARFLSSVQYPFKGNFDDIRIFNTVRTQVQIQADMFNTNLNDSAGLISHINFDYFTANGNNTGVQNNNIVPSNGNQMRSAVLTASSFNGTTSNYVPSDIYNTFTGSTSNLVSLGSNWQTGTVPNATNNIIIPSTASNLPATISGEQSFNNILIQSGASVVNNSTLSIAGSLLNDGILNSVNGTIVYNGKTPQIVNANTYLNKVLLGLTINNTGGVTLMDTTKLSQSLTLSSGVLTTNGRLVLLSDASGTGRVGAITGGSVNGDITVQRYLAGGSSQANGSTPAARGFRFFSHPFSTIQSINALIHGNGIDITGPGGASNGFINNTTPGATNNPSAFWYNASAVGAGSGTTDVGWIPFTRGNGTADGSNPNTWGRGQGVRVLFRGARGQGLNYQLTEASTHYTANAATVQVTGAINTGNQSISLPAPVVGNSKSWHLVGNPYPSQINIGAVLNRAYNNGNGGLASIAYVYNPNKQNTSRGGYDAIDISQNTAYILPTMGVVVVENIATGSNTIQFSESDKSDATSNLGFRSQSVANQIGIELTDSMGINIDEHYVRFNSRATDSIDAFDGSKMLNEFSVYGITNNQKLYLNSLPAPNTSTVLPLGIYAARAKQMRLVTTQLDVPVGMQAILRDKWLQQEQVLQNGTAYQFSVTADTASQGNHRFEIVLRPAATLPVNFQRVAANWVSPRVANISWSVGVEQNIQSYEVERSADGTQFNTIGTVPANNQNSYELVDGQAIEGNNYYRVKVKSQGGASKYSQVVLLRSGKGTSGIQLLPNIISQGADAVVQLQSLVAGQYQVQVVSKTGQVVYHKNHVHTGGNASLVLPTQTLVRGGYQVIVSNQQTKYVEQMLVQ